MASSDVAVRKATVGDVPVVKHIADRNRESLGFVLRPALLESFERGFGFVALLGNSVVGFIHYRHRLDEQTTMYQICVESAWRRKGVGRALINATVREAANLGKHRIILKSPESNQAAKAFYKAAGFVCTGIESGKRQRLALWEKKLSSENCE